MKYINRVVGDFGHILKHFGNYLSANLAQRALGIVSIPIFTRILNPEDYGIISLFTSYSAILAVIVTLNSYTSVGRYYYEKKDDFKNFFSLTILLSFVLIIVSSLVFTNSQALRGMVEIPESLILLLFLSIFLKVSQSLFSQVYQPQLKSALIARTNVISAYSGLGLAVIAVYTLPFPKYESVIYATLIHGLLFSLYYFILLKEYWVPLFKFEHLKYILSYSVPLIPYSLSGIILSQIDKIMIANYESFGSTGLYSFGYRIGMLLSIVVNSLNAAWTPKYFEYMNAKNYSKHDSDVNKMFFIIAAFSVLLLYFGEDLARVLADKKFHSAVDVIPVIVIGYLFQSIFTIYSRNIGFAKKTLYSSIIYISAGVINIFLNAYTIPRFGYKSAALNTTVSFFFLALASLIVTKYIIKIREYPLKRLLPRVLVVLLSALILYFINNQELKHWLTLLLKGIFSGIFVVVLFLLTQRRFKNSYPDLNED